MVKINEKSLKLVNGGHRKPREKSFQTNLNSTYFSLYQKMAASGMMFEGQGFEEVARAFREGRIVRELVEFIATFGEEDDQGKLIGFKNYNATAVLDLLGTAGAANVF